MSIGCVSSAEALENCANGQRAAACHELFCWQRSPDATGEQGAEGRCEKTIVGGSYAVEIEEADKIHQKLCCWSIEPLF